MKITALTKTLTLFSAVVAIGTTASCVAPAGGGASGSATGNSVTPTAKPVLDANGQPRKDLFISPYRPHNPIDTKGYSAGDIVGDPSTAQINSKTGKIIPSTAKPFRIPSLAPVQPAAPAPGN